MKYFFFFILLYTYTYAQQLSLKGNVYDTSTGEVLSYANLRIAGSSSGTAANLEGSFEFKLKPGNYSVITSYIGYKSDTTKIKLNGNESIKIFLEPVAVRLSEITVLPGENPANAVIRKTIEAKHEREEKINSYVFHAYTKGLVRTTQELSGSYRSGFGLSFSLKDTGNLKITGIMENESRGYFKKPNNYKDEVIAQKKSANIPPSVFVLTGGRMLQSFYTNDIQFFNRPLVGPIADNALDYYYYIIEDTVAMDNRNVYQLSFEPIDKSDPGFYGKIFIADGTFSLVKLDVRLNEAANPGKIFDNVNIFQQFVPLADNIYMPIDYRVFVSGNFLGMAKFGFELNSIFYDYQINDGIDDDLFDMVIIKVLPDADKKDSLYWNTTQTIPNTLEEIAAYQRIDSVEAVPRNFWDDFSILSPSVRLSDNYSISGPLSIYSFNKIQGHTLNFGGEVEDELNKRLYGTANFAYGFSDKKFQSSVSARYYLDEYRTTRLYLNAFNKLTDLFGEAISYNKLTSTITSLFGKYDFRDYYYTRGFDFKISDEIFPILRLGIGFMNRTDKSAHNNSDFSFFNKSKTYRENKKIFDTKINAITAEFGLDFRKFIEDGYFRFRSSQGKGYLLLNGSAIFSNKSLKSDLNFEMYNMTLSGNAPSFKSASMSFSLKGIYGNGSVPFQMLYALPGNIENSGKPNTFRTLGIGEVYGDRAAVFTFQHNFNDEIFRLLDIPYIKDWELILRGHFNAAWIELSDESRKILPYTFSEFKKPLMEAGFSIGHILVPFSLEFTWRLNHREKNNFVIGLNAFML